LKVETFSICFSSIAAAFFTALLIMPASAARKQQNAAKKEQRAEKNETLCRLLMVTFIDVGQATAN